MPVSAYKLIEACFDSLDEASALIDREPELLLARTPHLDETPLHYLVVEDQLDAVRLLVSKGAEINVLNGAGGSPLSEAASLGYEEIVSFLLSRGATMDVPGQDDPTIVAAVRSGSPRIIEILLEHGASLNSLDSLDRTPLHEAAAHDERFDVLVYLIGAGAKLTATDFAGATPLHEAALHGNPRNVRYLIEVGAVVSATDNRGCTALDVAGDAESKEILTNAAET